jgi:DNA-directed RNA polymerase subunit RPC12/RpoP
MEATEKLMAKYESTQVEIKTPEKSLVDPVNPEGYGCAKCGSKKYTLTSFNMWECSGCNSLFPYISRFDGLRTVKRLFWLTPCVICHDPWLMHSKSGGYYCLECQPFSLEDYDQLVCAGGLKH